MGTFGELGKRLDKFAEQVRTGTSSGIERTASETREWRKALDDLAEKMRKTAQDGMGRIAQETRDLSHSARVRSQMREKKRQLNSKLCELGRFGVTEGAWEEVDQEKLAALRAEIAGLDAEIEQLDAELQGSAKTDPTSPECD